MYRTLLFLFTLLFITNVNAQERIDIHYEGFLENIEVNNTLYKHKYPLGFNYIFTAHRLDIRTNDLNPEVYEKYDIDISSRMFYNSEMNAMVYMLNVINPFEERQEILLVYDPEIKKVIQITLYQTEKHKEINLVNKNLQKIINKKNRDAKKRK